MNQEKTLKGNLAIAEMVHGKKLDEYANESNEAG